MRVIIPYVTQSPAVWATVPDETEWHDVSADDDAYWRLLRDVWADGETFVVIEHDVIIHDDVLDQLAQCDQPWCAFPYDNICHWECMEAWANALGCTRFTAELIAACPDALAGIPEHQRDWHNLCDGIAGNKIDGLPAPVRTGSVRAAGYTHHWHFPPVRHDHGNAEIMVDWASVTEAHVGQPQPHS